MYTPNSVNDLYSRKRYEPILPLDLLRQYAEVANAAAERRAQQRSEALEACRKQQQQRPSHRCWQQKLRALLLSDIRQWWR
jgi:hypothetical protein